MRIAQSFGYLFALSDVQDDAEEARVAFGKSASFAVKPTKPALWILIAIFEFHGAGLQALLYRRLNFRHIFGQNPRLPRLDVVRVAGFGSKHVVQFAGQ